MNSRIHGILVVDKPAGITSRDAVNQIQGLLPRRTRIGHAGTLDPLATGVLVLCLGVATRLTEYVQRMEKEYITGIILGATSSTDDADGEIYPRRVTSAPNVDHVREQLDQFIGAIEQIPPAFSATKVAGKRAYDLARRGEDVKLAPRSVHIDVIHILEYDYPNLRLRIRCSKGTYVRSIARDLGEKLKCGGYVKTLRRTRIGRFTEESAHQLDSLNKPMQKFLRPVLDALAELPVVYVNDAQEQRLQHGQSIPFPPNTLPETEGNEAVVLCAGKPIAIVTQSLDGGALSPLKVLHF